VTPRERYGTLECVSEAEAERVVGRNHVTVRGRGARTIVFGHGFGLDQTCWRHVAPAFEADYRVVTFDYVGSGRSDRSAYNQIRYGTLDGYAEDLLEVLAALRCEPCVFVGASISGMIGLTAARTEPQRFSRLVMIGSSARYIDDPPDYRGGFAEEDIDGLLDVLDQNFVGWAANMASTAIKEPDIATELERGICAIDPRVARQFAEVVFRCDMRAALPTCQQPVLIVQCQHDDIVPNTAAQYLAEHLPRSRYRQLPATGHCPHLTHPAEVRKLILDYLDSPAER
jgi:sigma-B regulation protein RsbQ